MSSRGPTTRLRRIRTRGQGVVEFALVLPILLLFLMVAVDFGRVYLGWVNLQNMARIAANYAANNAESFALNDPATAAIYQRQILNDAQATNCRIHTTSGTPDQADPPVFTGYQVGDAATVTISCTFGVVTPIISNVLGNSIEVSASAQFPVKTGIIAATNTGGGGGGGSPVTASFSCTPRNGPVTLAVQCNDESGGSPTTWQWTVTGPGGSVQTSGIQDPSFLLTDPGSYSVELTVDNALGQPSTLTLGNYITAGVPSTVDFIADVNSGPAPLAVQFTDQSSGTPTAWAWDFDDDGTVDDTTQNPQHTYTTAGLQDVRLTVTNAAGTFSTVKVGYISVGVASCTVPSFTGVRRNSAVALWVSQGFTAGNLTDAPGAPNGNYVIQIQSITPGTVVPCDSQIQVDN